MACKEYIYIYMYIYNDNIYIYVYIYRYVYKFSEHRLVFDFFTHYLQPPNGEIFEKPKNHDGIGSRKLKMSSRLSTGCEKNYTFFSLYNWGPHKNRKLHGKIGTLKIDR